MESGAHGCADAALDLFEALLNPSSLDDIRRDLGLGGRSGLFSTALTLWLFIRRRLLGLSIEAAWLSCSPADALRLSPTSARAKKGVLSIHESGFDYARHHIPLALVEAASDRLFAEAQTLLGSDTLGWFLLDGSSLTLEGTPELTKAFPPAVKKGKAIHWPVLKVAVIHDLQSGLAMRPALGPMHGPHAVSEQALAHRLIERLPQGCGVIADKNFGILQIAWALRNHRMLIRLTDVRAKAMLKGKALAGQDADVLHDWTPSPWEKSHRKELGKEVKVSGRIVVRHVIGPKGKKVRVCLFTNDLTASPEELVLFYTKRWNIETDLRSLKQTVNLEIVGARTPDMVAKELILSVAAYNVIRTVMAQAAKLTGVEPRKLSFARTKGCIIVFAMRGPATDQSFTQMLYAIAGKPIPNRGEKRSFPRQTWRRVKDFPARTTGGARENWMALDKASALHTLRL